VLKKKINWDLIKDFNGRPGWTVTATILSAEGRQLHYECTKQFTTPQGAMDAFTGWMRRMSVEDQAE